MIVKRQSASASPRQVLAAIDPLSSTIIYLGAFEYRHCLERVVKRGIIAGTSQLLMSVSVTGSDGFVVFFRIQISPANDVFT